MNAPTPEEYRLQVQLDDLKERLATAYRENAELRVSRDTARAQVRSLLPKATPEQEEEFRRELEAGGGVDFSELVAELTAAMRAPHGGQ